MIKQDRMAEMNVTEQSNCITNTQAGRTTPFELGLKEG